jgi:hypothetical protein
VIDLAKSPVKNPQPAVNDKRPAIRVGNPAMDVHLEKDNLVIVPNVKPAVRLGNKLVVIPAPGK